MSNVLSQDEVDSLLKGVSSGEIETETDMPPPEDGTIQYDFTRQDQIIRGRMPTLEILNGRFATIFRTSLSTMVRKDVDVDAGSVEMVKFEDFHHSLPVPTSLHIFRMEPLMGQALLIFDTRLVFGLIECYFGGKGTEQVRIEGREFTPIETSTIRKTVKTCLQDLATAWQPVHKLKMSYIRSEINPQFATIVFPGDLVIVVRFDVEVEGTSGKMTLCIPYSTIEPIRNKLYGGYQGDQQNVDVHWKRRLQERIWETGVNVIVELGRAQITAERLLGLKVGDVVQLDQDVSSHLTAKIEGMPKFKGRAGVVRNNRAIKIEKRCLRSEA
ncbi:MAG: flagellar motor switch protein FliM [Desulfobacterales bacterium]|nr:flagellar motor switch protein FliM [Desulfobacterales bacterium]